jgi:hypothetical protein
VPEFFLARNPCAITTIAPETTAAGPAERNESDPRQNVCHCAGARAGDDAPGIVEDRIRPDNDQAEVVQLLKDGCTQMRKAFDIEDLNLDALIDTAMEDPKTIAGEIRAFRGINFDDLAIAYKQFCGNDSVDTTRFDMKPVIEFYNGVAANLPDHNRLKNLKLPGTSVVLDGKGDKFAELFESDHRRVWVPLS